MSFSTLSFKDSIKVIYQLTRSMISPTCYVLYIGECIISMQVVLMNTFTDPFHDSRKTKLLNKLINNYCF